MLFSKHSLFNFNLYFFDLLLHQQVQLIPGSLMEGGEGLVRISYATSMENIIEGCRRLSVWLNFL